MPAVVFVVCSSLAIVSTVCMFQGVTGRAKWDKDRANAPVSIGLMTLFFDTSIAVMLTDLGVNIVVEDP